MGPKILGEKDLFTKKMSKKIIWSKNKLSPKKIQNDFGFKKIFDQKNFGSENFGSNLNREWVISPSHSKNMLVSVKIAIL